MLDLRNVTLLALSSNRIEATKRALHVCRTQADFGETLLFTHEPQSPQADFRTVLVPEMDYHTYAEHCIKTLPLHVTTDFMLKVEWDGFLVNPAAWTDDFFQYDYIGAPWPFWDHQVGNGGFSLRSKRLLEAIKEVFADVKVEAEDTDICCRYRDVLEAKGIRFAPPEIGYRFSTEMGRWDENRSFGFHDFRYNDPFGMKDIQVGV